MVKNKFSGNFVNTHLKVKNKGTTIDYQRVNLFRRVEFRLFFSFSAFSRGFLKKNFSKTGFYKNESSFYFDESSFREIETKIRFY